MTRSSTRATARNSNRRHLSQNFLVDPQVAATVVRRSGVGRDDLVLETGSGRGILTNALERAGGHVTAYELDARYAARLRDRYRGHPRITCLHRDFLDSRPPARPFAVVANIPYSRTGAIIDWCLAAPELTSATLMTQWEYARKRTGAYGRWSRLTVLTWPQTVWRLNGRIDRRKFRPVPKVDSGILRLVRRPEPLLNRRERHRFEALVTLGFTGLGGALYSSLRREVPAAKLRRGFAKAGLDPAVPVGLVSPGAWLEIFDAVR